MDYRAANEEPRELRTAFASTTGGVLTEEVGAVTGDLEAATTIESVSFQVSVRYSGAKEWYKVVGSPVPIASDHTRFSHTEMHQQVLAALTRPATTRAANELAVDLSNLLYDPEGRG